MHSFMVDDPLRTFVQLLDDDCDASVVLGGGDSEIDGV
jgi:hypothetical protein